MSLLLELGNYMQIGRTSNRDDYSSSTKTSFYSFRDKCLEVFYVQTGELTVGFTIQQVTEDLNTEIIFKVTPGELPNEHFEDTLAPVYKWTRVYMRLPDGIYQLELKGKRPGLRGKTTGFVLDDLAIWPCAEFGEYSIWPLEH